MAAAMTAERGARKLNPLLLLFMAVVLFRVVPFDFP
jgi:hypothetical protein